MMPGLFELLIFLVVLIVIIVPYLFAKNLNNKLQRESPSFKSFTWGYYQGVGIMLWTLLSTLPLLPLLIAGGTLISLLVLISLILSITLGYYTIKRSKIAFIILTILLINPIIWIINGIYIKNRWDELV